MSGKDAKKRTTQFAALPWRQAGADVQVLLITSRETHRWLIPKGWPMKGKSGSETAAQEAYEEAGVVGEIGGAPLGAYRYIKRADGGGSNVEVTVFGLEVLVERQAWPEQDQRRKQWFNHEIAAEMVEEPELRTLIQAFGQHH